MNLRYSHGKSTLSFEVGDSVRRKNKKPCQVLVLGIVWQKEWNELSSGLAIMEGRKEKSGVGLGLPHVILG
jgi:hypothetical protein